MLGVYQLHPAWRYRPRVMAVFITVLIVLGALLVLDNTIFGLYTFTIYFYVIRYLVWPWRLVGAAGIGLLAATSQAYGVNKDTAAGVLIYLIIIAVERGHRDGLRLVPVAQHRAGHRASSRWTS